MGSPLAEAFTQPATALAAEALIAALEQAVGADQAAKWTEAAAAADGRRRRS